MLGGINDVAGRSATGTDLARDANLSVQDWVEEDEG